MVAVDINGATAGTTQYGGKEQGAEFMLETNEPKSGRGAVGSDA
jgi:hypothetical protein